MDLRQLRTFLEVSEVGSLSKASDRLHVTQPALSRQIRLLEEELAVTLFARHGRGMILTEAGLLLASHARDILGRLEDARVGVSNYNETVRGSVSLGVPPTVGDVHAARIVEKFHRRYPQVMLRVVPAFSGYLLDFLDRREIDLAVVYAIEQPRNFELIPLMAEELHLVGPASAGLLPDRPVSFSEAVRHPLVLPGPQHGLRLLISRRAAESGVSLSVPIEVDALQTLKDLVARSLGFTILPLDSIQPSIEAGFLSSTPITGPPLRRHLMLARHAGRAESHAVALFRALLQEELSA